MYYILFLALPLLLMGATYVDASYFGDKDPPLEKVVFDLIPLESIKPTMLFEKFVYKPGKKKLVGGETSEMVHFNPEIYSTDKRYKLAKRNRDIWEEKYGEKAKVTYKAFEPLTKIPIEKLK